MRLALRTSALALALCTAATVAGAETRSVEAVGAVPAQPGASPGGPEREGALRAALAEAVVQVGLSLVANPDPVATRPRVEAALAGDPRDYTARYRVTEDRGAGPRSVLSDPAVRTEYAVKIEAQVDVTRVRARLVAAGLVPKSDAPVPVAPTELHHLTLVLESLPSYQAYAAVRSALVERAGAKSAQPREFTRGRAVLAVETAQPAAALAQGLPALLAPELRVETVSAEGDTVRARLVAAPTPASPPPSAASSQKAPAN
ncbi:MAG TPA: hypothetical protein VK714_08655 [Myxococcota bacterium]|nr:hypothetical protein [Myxococcota bacterium]